MSSSWLRVLTTPGRCASASRIRNSVTVRVTSFPSHNTLCRAESMTRRPRSSSGGAVRIDAGDEPFLLQRDGHRSEDVPVIVDQRDLLAHPPLVPVACR